MASVGYSYLPHSEKHCSFGTCVFFYGVREVWSLVLRAECDRNDVGHLKNTCCNSVRNVIETHQEYNNTANSLQTITFHSGNDFADAVAVYTAATRETNDVETTPNTFVAPILQQRRFRSKTTALSTSFGQPRSSAAANEWSSLPQCLADSRATKANNHERGGKMYGFNVLELFIVKDTCDRAQATSEVRGCLNLQLTTDSVAGIYSPTRIHTYTYCEVQNV